MSQDLRRRRVAPALAQTVVDKTYKNVDEAALIEEFIRRKYRDAPREDLFRDDKQLASAYRRLLRAGFGSGNIIRALKRFAANPELARPVRATGRSRGRNDWLNFWGFSE